MYVHIHIYVHIYNINVYVQIYKYVYICKGPPYGWKDRGIFTVGRTGQRSLQVSRNLGQWLPPWPQESKLHGGRGSLPSGCRRPVGDQGSAWALSRRQRAPGSRESPPLPEKPEPWPQGPPWPPGKLPWGLVPLPQAQVRRRWMPFVDIQDRRPPMPSWTRGYELWGTKTKR